MQRIELQQESDQRVESGRSQRRFVVTPDKRVTIEFDRLDGRVAAEAILRDISVGGAGLWIGTFIHPETKCWLLLGPRSEPDLQIQGKVRWCKHFAHSLHEVGIQLDDVNPDVLDVTLNPQQAQSEEKTDDAVTLLTGAMRELRAKAEEGLTPEEMVTLITQLEPAIKLLLTERKGKQSE